MLKKSIMKNSRNQIIDVLKGIAVLAVLLGHAIQRGLIVNYETNFLFRIIYSFHMPLFMILSGYSLSKYVKKYDLLFLKKRFCRLIIPTIVWSYLIYFFRDFNFVGIKPFIPFPDSVIDYTKILLLHIDYVIWFLYIVFLCDIIYFVLNKTIKNNKIDIILCIILHVILLMIPNQNFGIYRLMLYFPLFSVGYYLARYQTILEKSKYLIIPSVLLYIFLFKKFSVYINSVMIYYCISISAIIIIYNFVKYFNKLNITIINKIFNFLSFFGKLSLEIYLCQCLCLNIGVGSGYLRIITIFITATTISIILAKFTTKNNVLSLVLYGNMIKK